MFIFLNNFLKIISKYNTYILFIVFFLFLIVLWQFLSDIGVNIGYMPNQPLKFSHKVHCGDNNINCIYCHSSVTKSQYAELPPLHLCMNCHKFIKEGSNKEMTKNIQTLYNSIRFNFENQNFKDTSNIIKWEKVHNLPDLVNFNHFQHYIIGKVDCIKCHGDVKTMDNIEQVFPLTMQWCLDCHKTDTINYNKYKNYYKEFKNKCSNKSVLKIDGLECGKCHY